MINRIFFIILGVFIVLGFFVLWPDNFVSAQGVGIKISPVKVEEIVEPGEILEKILKVTNKSTVNKTFYIYLRDFKSDDELGHARLISPGTEEGYFLASWIEAPKEGINFAPNEEKHIKYRIHVPAEAGPGGYFGAIVVGTQPPRLFIDSEEKGAGISIAQQTASLLLLRVKGDVYEEALVREFNTGKDFYSTPFLVNFLLRIENSGNVHVRPRGVIRISNMFGKDITVLRVNEKRGNILPRSIRRFDDVSWKGNLQFGKFTAKLSLTYGINVSEGGQGKSSIFAAKSFWIIPWRVITPIFLSLIIITGLAVLFLKLYKNKAIRRAMEQAGLGHVRYVKQFKGPSPTIHIGMILLVIFMVLSIILGAVYFLFFA